MDGVGASTPNPAPDFRPTRDLNLTKIDAVRELLARYYPLERFPPKTFFALEELLSE